MKGKQLVGHIKIIDIDEKYVTLEIVNTTEPSLNSTLEILKFDDEIKLYFIPDA